MTLEPIALGRQHDPGVLFEQGELVIPSDTRRKHTAIFGTTGAGKSTLMRNMIATDPASGMGCTVVDPHGQLVEDILNNHVPRPRTDDVIYFNPKDPARTIPLNLLDSPSGDLDGLVVDNVMGIFKQLWPDAFAVGARMEDIFRNSFYALIEHPSPSAVPYEQRVPRHDPAQGEESRRTPFFREHVQQLDCFVSRRSHIPCPQQVPTISHRPAHTCGDRPRPFHIPFPVTDG